MRPRTAFWHWIIPPCAVVFSPFLTVQHESQGMIALDGGLLLGVDLATQEMLVTSHKQTLSFKDVPDLF